MDTYSEEQKDQKPDGLDRMLTNKTLKPLQFTSHMFRHAFIDRLKGCGDIPVKLAESITGHSSGGSDFDHYGTVGYSLEQKLTVIKRVEV